MKNTKKIIEEALHLPRDARALLAERLLESLDYDEGFEINAEWMQEIQRRCKEIDNNQVQLVPAEEVFAHIKNKLS